MKDLRQRVEEILNWFIKDIANPDWKMACMGREDASNILKLIEELSEREAKLEQALEALRTATCRQSKGSFNTPERYQKYVNAHFAAKEILEGKEINQPVLEKWTAKEREARFARDLKLIQHSISWYNEGGAASKFALRNIENIVIDCLKELGLEQKEREYYAKQR